MVRDGAAYQKFCDMVDGPLLVVSILWLPVLIIPLVSHPSPSVSDTLNAIDYTVWAIFVVEYLTKLYLAPDRRTFVRKNIPDLIVILSVPFVKDVRAFQFLRLLRLIRVAVVLVEVLERAKDILTHRGLHFVLLAVVLLVAAAAGLELAFEQHQPHSNIHNFGDALWWAVVTVTTVGYGDRYPTTAAGRGVAVVLMLVGIGLVGTVTATVASYFVEQRQDDHRDELAARLDRIEGMLEQLLEERGTTPAAVTEIIESFE